MDNCCYDCPVANCTVNELLRHIKNSCDNSCGCTNGAGAIVAALLPPYIIFGIVIPVIIAALLFYHFVYKKKHHQLDARLTVASFFTGYCNICKRKSRSQSDRPDCRSDHQIVLKVMAQKGLHIMLLIMKPELLHLRWNRIKLMVEEWLMAKCDSKIWYVQKLCDSLHCL